MEDRAIDIIIRKCGNTQDNKRRTYLYYKKEKPTTKEFADFLKKAYGIGGTYPAYREGDLNKGDKSELHWSWESFGYRNGKQFNGLIITKSLFEKNPDPKGLPYKSTDLDSVGLTWTEVADRTAKLIDNGSFMDVKDYSSGSSRWNLRKLIWA